MGITTMAVSRARTRAGSHAHMRAHMHELTIPKKYTVSKTMASSDRSAEHRSSPAAVAAPAADLTGRRIHTRRSGVHGKGVFAEQDLAEGETQIEYVGEVITWTEALRRHPHDPNDPNHTFYFHVDEDHVIDAKNGGNSSRWINHSCKPNCEADETDGRVFIKALRNIRAGEELFYDYGLIIDAPYTTKLLAEYPCWCGAKKCRGTLLAPKDKKDSKRDLKKAEKEEKKAEKKAQKKAEAKTDKKTKSSKVAKDGKKSKKKKD